MTTIECLDAVAEYLPQVIQDFRMELPAGTSTRVPQVVKGWLPPKDPKHPDNEDVPYVLPRLVGHDDVDEGVSFARIHIFVGTFSEDIDGWRDIANIIERIRQAFLKNRVIGKKFRLELPMKSVIPDEQPRVHWVGWLETRWAIAQPIEEVLFDE